MAKKKNIKWENNDVFAIPLENGAFTICQVLDLQMVNIVRIAVYDEKILNVNAVKLDNFCNSEDLISLIACSREQLDYGVWKILGNKEQSIPISKFPNEQYRTNGWVGAKHYDAAIIEDFVNAFYALIPWDDWGNPLYLDSLLVDKGKKPQNLLFIKK